MNFTALRSDLRLLFLHPMEIVRREILHSSVADGVMKLAFYSEIPALFLVLSMAMTGAPAWLLGIFLMFSVIGLPVAAIIYSFILSLVEYALLRLMGGKCRFDELYHPIAVLFIPMTLLISSVYGPSMRWALAALFPDGLPLALLAFALANLPHLFALYILTLIIKEAGKMGAFKAILCWLLPLTALIGVYVLFFLAFSMSTGLMPVSPLMGAKVDGFKGMALSGPPIIGADGPDRCVFNLIFYNDGEEVIVDGASFKITRDGKACGTRNMVIDAVDLNPAPVPGETTGSGYMGLMPAGTFITRDLAENPAVTIKSGMPFVIKGEASGPGCGGLKGGEYTYDVAFDLDRTGGPQPNAGTVSGKYVNKNADVEFEVGYFAGTPGRSARWSVRGL
jgi:hypothetical protein